MKKILLPFAAVLMFASCSKQTKEEVNVAEVAGTYQGDAKLWGPSSCIKGEGNEKISVISTTAKQISVSYIQHGNLPGFVPFPSVKANLVSKQDGVYFFMVEPITTADYKVWQTDTHTVNGTSYNIAIFPDGRIDARMSYYDFHIPQGSQYFDFSGVKIN